MSVVMRVKYQWNKGLESYRIMVLLISSPRLKDDQLISQTGMAILDVGMLSGFSLPTAAAAPTDLIRKVEIQPEKVSLYLDSVSVSSCHRFMVVH